MYDIDASLRRDLALVVYPVSRVGNRGINSQCGDATLQFRAEQLRAHGVGQIHSCKLRFGKNSNHELDGTPHSDGSWIFSLLKVKEVVLIDNGPSGVDGSYATAPEVDGLFEGLEAYWSRDETQPISDLIANSNAGASMGPIDWVLLSQVSDQCNFGDVLDLPSLPSTVTLDGMGLGCFIAAYRVRVSTHQELHETICFIDELKENGAKLVNP